MSDQKNDIDTTTWKIIYPIFPYMSAQQKMQIARETDQTAKKKSASEEKERRRRAAYPQKIVSFRRGCSR